MHRMLLRVTEVPPTLNLFKKKRRHLVKKSRMKLLVASDRHDAGAMFNRKELAFQT